MVREPINCARDSGAARHCLARGERVKKKANKRADKAAERLVRSAYRRAIHGFDRYDTTTVIDN